MTQNVAKPKLAVWMLVHNHQDFVEQAVNSVMAQQSDFDFHLYIGEDHSTDGTAEICKALKLKYPDRITLFLNEKNMGGRENAFQIYEACLESGAQYMALLEGDDFWTDPSKLQKQVDFLEAYPDYSFSWTRFQTLDQRTGKLTLDFNTKHFLVDEDVIDFNFEKSLKGWHIGTQTLVFRSNLFDLNAMKKFKYFRDTHIIAHLLRNGKGSCLNFVSAVYRNHDAGIHSSITVFNGYKTGYYCHKEIYEDYKENIYLKKKYLLSFQNFIMANIQEGFLLNAFWLNFKLMWAQWEMKPFLKNMYRIVKKAIEK